jgi:hypothetical protein
MREATMAVLDYVLAEELARLQRYRSHLSEDMGKLPKGSISIKIKAKRPYAYLSFRQGKKVVSTYVGAAGNPKVVEISQQIDSRRKLEADSKAADASIARIRRMMDVG